jgi:hypothetical protein
MSLKNKYKVVKKLYGFPEEGKLYSNSSTVDNYTVVTKCTRMNKLYLKYLDGDKNHYISIIGAKPLWEVELITTPESEKPETLEELTFPCEMLVSDDNVNFQKLTIVAYLGDKFSFPWIGFDLNFSHYIGYKFAKPITDEFIYLSFQDISDGKGVGVNPSLIRIKN